MTKVIYPAFRLGAILPVMSRGIGFVAALIVVAFGMYYAMTATKTVSPKNGTPQATVETVGIEQDLLAIANAERRYNASKSKYVPLDELIASGELQMPRTTRGPYSYSVEVNGEGFLATAHASIVPQGAPANMTVDEQMRVSHD